MPFDQHQPLSPEEEARKNFELALAQVCENYPNFSERIKTSLETPQLGKHHNEGPKMDSHLSLILATLNAVRNGIFHESILGDKNLCETMRSVVVKEDKENSERSTVNPAFIDYTFFHDISKPDCLTLKIEGGETGVEITWEQWKEIEQNGRPYSLWGKQVESISYYHESEGSAGQHGNKAVGILEGRDIPSEIVIAISKHEVAYQFAKINALTYEEHFVKPDFTENQQKFILVASYIDAMGSLLDNGEPDLSNFINLINSRKNFLMIKVYVDRGIVFRENELTFLKKQNKILTREDIEKIIPREKKYNIPALGDKLDVLVSGGKITESEKGEILSLALSSPKDIGKRFGSRMRFIKPLLAESEL